MRPRRPAEPEGAEILAFGLAMVGYAVARLATFIEPLQSFQGKFINA